MASTPTDLSAELTPSNGALPHSPEIVTPASARALFWHPRYTAGSEALRHLPFLFWLVDLARPARMAQLGLGDGVGYFALCQALERTSAAPQAAAVTAAAVAPPLARYNEDHYAEFSRISPGDARDLAGRMAEASVDLLVIGAVPDEAGVAALADEWPKKLSARGVIAILGAADWPADGAARLWLDKMGLAHPTISFEAGDGLAIFLIGPDQPPRLAELARLGDAAGEAHHVFRRLGAAVHHEWAARAEADRAEALDAEIARLTETLAARERAVAALEARVAAGGPETAGMADLLQRHGEAQAELGRMRAEIAEAQVRADHSRQAAREAREAATVAEAARSEAERRSAERLAAKDRALDQIGSELTAVRTEAEVLRRGDDLQALTRQLEASRDDRDTVNQALQSLKVAHAALSAEVDTLRAERDGALAHADAVVNSTFWKLTSPARRIVRGLRRLRGGRSGAEEG